LRKARVGLSNQQCEKGTVQGTAFEMVEEGDGKEDGFEIVTKKIQ
jgi:hypothetical protein